MPLLALLLAATQGAETPTAPPDLIQQVLPAPGQNLKLWIPLDYKKDPFVSLKFDRKRTAASNEAVTLRMALLEQKLTEHPAPPGEADLLRVDPSLTYVNFTGSVTTWKGREVPTGRYEGFVQGKLGVYGRVLWLPLEPGTVVLDLYAEPAWMDALNRDWDAIVGNLSGPVVERTLRERAPSRWLATTLLAGTGVLLAVVGIVLLIGRMNEEVGGSLTYLGLFVPIVPIGYGVMHLNQCWKGLALVFSGLGLFGLSLLLGR